MKGVNCGDQSTGSALEECDFAVLQDISASICLRANTACLSMCVCVLHLLQKLLHLTLSLSFVFLLVMWGSRILQVKNEYFF